MVDIILNGLRKGNSADMKTVFELYYPKLVLFIYSKIENKEDAKERAADCIFNFFKTLPDSLENDEQIKAYLFTSAQNSCNDHHRKSNRKKNKATIVLFPPDATEEFDKGIEEAYDTGLAEKVMGIIEKMPTQMQQVVMLRFVEGMKAAEIAPRLKMSLPTVYNHITAGRKLILEEFPNLALPDKS